jgi:anaerobic magnesium-protoporphyrin IX monomethyl ester cyclase
MGNLTNYMPDSKEIDLLIVHPSSNKTVYGELDKVDLPAIEPPFMAALTAGFIRNKGHSVDILDANVEGLTFEETAERVLNYNPKLISIISHGHQPSASSQLMGAIGETCREIKGRIDTPIILSGIHPSSLPERTLREESIDFVSRGEEYYTLHGLLDGGLYHKDFSNIPGLAYLDEGVPNIRNLAAPLIKNLDEELSDVAWDLLPSLKNYRAHNWHAFFADTEERQPYSSLYTSLGCPFKCSFCCINAEFKASIADNKKDSKDDLEGKLSVRDEGSLLKILEETSPNIRFWSPEKVMESLDYFAKQGVHHVKFIDEMFVFNKRHVEGIADEIIERGYDFNIWAYARIDTVKDRRLLDKIKKAGVNWLALGIESANSDIRYGAEKNFKDEEIYKHVRQVEDAGINVLGNFMVGLRHDTQETMRQTLDMAMDLNALWFNIYATMAYPGAPDYNWAKQKGFALPGDPGVEGGWTAYSHYSRDSLPLPTETLSAAEVLKFRDDAFNEYFGPKNTLYRKLVKSKLGEKAVNHIDEMVSRKIPRRILEN